MPMTTTARKQCASTQRRTHPEIGKMIRDLFDDPMPILYWPMSTPCKEASRGTWCQSISIEARDGSTKAWVSSCGLVRHTDSQEPTPFTFDREKPIDRDRSIDKAFSTRPSCDSAARNSSIAKSGRVARHDACTFQDGACQSAFTHRQHSGARAPMLAPVISASCALAGPATCSAQDRVPMRSRSR